MMLPRSICSPSAGAGLRRKRRAAVRVQHRESRTSAGSRAFACSRLDGFAGRARRERDGELLDVKILRTGLPRGSVSQMAPESE
jgi:hypothetical protein